GVEDVADEDDLPPEVAQLAGGDGAAVQPAAKSRERPEVSLVPGRAAGERSPDGEEAADAIGVAHAGGERPGHHDLVARVLVDLALRLDHGVREVVHEATQQLEVRVAAQ